MLVLLVAVAGGAVLTAAAGARRTDSAYPRFLRASRAADVFVSPAARAGGYYRALARLPGWRRWRRWSALNAQPCERWRRMPRPGGGPLDGRFGHSLEVPKVLAGRLPRPGRRGEVAVNQIGAATLHLHVGSSLTMRAVPMPLARGATGRRAGPRCRAGGRHLRHPGLGAAGHRPRQARRSFFASTALLALVPRPRLRGRSTGRMSSSGRGSPRSAFARQAQALARPFPRTGGQVFVADEAAQAATVERSIRPRR